VTGELRLFQVLEICWIRRDFVLVDVQLSVWSSFELRLVHLAAVLSRAALQQYYCSALSAAADVILLR
jgi:hypothetical protein